MKLWTVQHPRVLPRLAAHRCLHGDGRYVNAYWRPMYRWMMQQMTARLGPSPSGRYPVWAWDRRPDLRQGAWGPRGARRLLIAFDLPESRVLRSSFSAWHCVLNDQYLSYTEADDRAFDAALAAAGLTWQDRPFPEPFAGRVVASWARVFELDRLRADAWVVGSDDTAQCTLWELPQRTIRSITPFTCR